MDDTDDTSLGVCVCDSRNSLGFSPEQTKQVSSHTGATPRNELIFVECLSCLFLCMCLTETRDKSQESRDKRQESRVKRQELPLRDACTAIRVSTDIRVRRKHRQKSQTHAQTAPPTAKHSLSMRR
jgi:hypothetical protein